MVVGSVEVGDYIVDAVFKASRWLLVLLRWYTILNLLSYVDNLNVCR